MEPRHRKRTRGPKPVWPVNYDRVYYYEDFGNRPNNRYRWQENDSSQYETQPPGWQRPNRSHGPTIPNNSMYRINGNPSYAKNVQFENLSWKPNFQRMPRPSVLRPQGSGYKSRYPTPIYPEPIQIKPKRKEVALKEIETVSSDVKLTNKPLSSNDQTSFKSMDKSLHDTIDTVKRKLRERKQSDAHENESVFVMDSLNEISLPIKISEKKRIEHSKMSPKSIAMKKSDKKDDANNKNKGLNLLESSKLNTSKKSQVLQRKIIQQLFRLNNNNLRQVLSHPESSTKFNFALTSLIKDTRNKLSKELRNVAEKSLEYHNISADTVQGEQIVQDAFLGHLGTMLDQNASIELFNMEPQLIKELSKVLQENLMSSDNEDVSVRNLTNIMHENISEQSSIDNNTDIKIGYSVRSMDSMDGSMDYNEKNDEFISNIFPGASQIIEPKEEQPDDVCYDQYDNEGFDHCLNNYENQIQNYEKDATRECTKNIGIEKLPRPNFIRFVKMSELLKSPNLDQDKNESQIQNDNVSCNTYDGNHDCTNEVLQNNVSKPSLIDSANCIDDHFKDARIYRNIQSVADNSDLLNEDFTNDNFDTKKSSRDYAYSDKIQCKKIGNINEPNWRKKGIKQSLKCVKTHRKHKLRRTIKNAIHLGDSSNNINGDIRSKFLLNSNSKPGKKSLKKKELNNVEKSSPNGPKMKETQLENTEIEQNHSVVPGLDDTNSVCGNCGMKDVRICPSTKSQGTQYHNFGKSDIATQVDNSLIFSISRGTQYVKQRLKKGSVETFHSSFPEETIPVTTVEISCQTNDSFDHVEKQDPSTDTVLNVKASDVSKDIQVSSQSEILEKMKQIDNDIQLMVQEKFKLYKMLESNHDIENLGNDYDTSNLKVCVEPTILLADCKESKHPDTDKTSKISKNDDLIEREDLNTTFINEIGNVKNVTNDHQSPLQFDVVPGKEEICKENIQNVNLNLADEKDAENSNKSPILNKKKRQNSSSVSISKVEQTVKKTSKRKTEISSLEEKYNLKNCSVVIKKMSIYKVNQRNYPDLVQSLVENINDATFKSDAASLDHYNNAQYVQESDIPNMLENETLEDMSLIENWDSKLFENIPLSESMEGLDMSLVDVSIPQMKESMLSQKKINIQNKMKTDTVCCENPESFAGKVKMTDHSGSIIAIESVGNNILAASQDGNVYYYCSLSGELIRSLKCSNIAITCLFVKPNSNRVYTGSLDSHLRCFDYEKGTIELDTDVEDQIQSMCSAWNTIFIGTRSGYVVKFNTMTNTFSMDLPIKFSDQCILAIYAIKEGPRKVLLIASRSQDVSVHDANSGLLLRTFYGSNVTVYSLLFHLGHVFCGTGSSEVQVYDFVTGDLLNWHCVGKGAISMKMYRGLLFVGCYDGVIYVFKPGMKNALANIPSQGKMLLAMDVVNDKIIGGFNDKSLSVWPIPKEIMNQMNLMWT